MPDDFVTPTKLMAVCDSLRLRNIKKYGYSIDSSAMFEYATHHLAVSVYSTLFPDGTEKPSKYEMVSDFRRRLRARFCKP